MINKASLAPVLDTASPVWGTVSFEAVNGCLLECRAKQLIPENARSVIVCLFPYRLDSEAYEGANVSKYAVVADYHTVITGRLSRACEELKKLFPENSFVCFTDNSPLPEVFCAITAGLGCRGDNGLFISKKYGSFVFLGEIVTDAVIETAAEKDKGCLHCGKCKKACPGSAISENGVDISKCLSHISQKKGELTEQEKNAIKNNGSAWGCDVCQDVCPLNQNTQTTPISEFKQSAVAKVKPGCPLEGRAYAWRGRKVIERNLKLFEEE